MAYDGYFKFGDIEIVNLSRTAQLAASMRIPSVWVRPADVAWIQTALGGAGYGNVANAPWYDAQFPASAEFAGVIPLSVQGLDDSTLEASTTEFVGDGGQSGSTRNGTLSIVWNVTLVGSTDRGVEFGRRWLANVLRGPAVLGRCGGTDLTYFRYPRNDAPMVHRRAVSTTRGMSITRKRSAECSVLWTTTFTMTADDPYEYGENIAKITELGPAAGATGPGVQTSGTLTAVQVNCPVYDYTPVYDPLYPALVSPPTAPTFLPPGWTIQPGVNFQRRWARVFSVEPSSLATVPVMRLSSTIEARMVRISIWDAAKANNAQCDPLFSVVVTYLPVNTPIYIDGEQRASYTWDGVSPSVRRTDSLLYAPTGQPMIWTGFNDPSQLLVTLDAMEKTPGVYQGEGALRLSLDLVPKSD